MPHSLNLLDVSLGDELASGFTLRSEHHGSTMAVTVKNKRRGVVECCGRGVGRVSRRRWP
jgi:hypothetical protein